MKLICNKTSLLLLFGVVFSFISGFSQVKLPVLHESLFSTYYHQRMMFGKSMPQTKDEIIFLGNSITDGFEWAQLFNDLWMKNHGISGDVTAGVLHHVTVVTNRKPMRISGLNKKRGSALCWGDLSATFPEAPNDFMSRVVTI